MKTNYAREYRTKKLALKALDDVCKAQAHCKEMCRAMKLQNGKWVVLDASFGHSFLMEGYKNKGYWWCSNAINVTH